MLTCDATVTFTPADSKDGFSLLLPTPSSSHTTTNKDLERERGEDNDYKFYGETVSDHNKIDLCDMEEKVARTHAFSPECTHHKISRWMITINWRNRSKNTGARERKESKWN